MSKYVVGLGFATVACCLLVAPLFAQSQGVAEELQVPADVNAWIQADVDAKLASLDAGEPCCGDETNDLFQVIDLEDGAQAVVYDDFALLVDNGTILGLNFMMEAGGSIASNGDGGVDVECEWIGGDTMFCTYQWGGAIRVMIYRQNADGTWTLVFDSGWFREKQNPGSFVEHAQEFQIGALGMAIRGVHGEDFYNQISTSANAN